MDFDRRLTALRDRRLGLSKLQKSMDGVAFATASQRSLLTERYQKRSSNRATRYALGAMEEVKADYTAISIEEGTRIGKQLINRLPANWHMECELQGSVPLNVHIEGVSDVDLLALRTDHLRFTVSGPKANTYTTLAQPSSLDVIWGLRERARIELGTAFPACSIDASGSKSLSMTEGSLRRKVDVVPAIWWHTAEYQAYNLKKDKGVAIMDVHAWLTTDNLPFLHIHEVASKDHRTVGGARKVIRLLKTMKEDSDDKPKISLSSYDIAGLVWQMNEADLTVHPWSEITLVDVAQSCLRYFRENKTTVMGLMTPDGTRRIVDTEAKFQGLVLLSLEVDTLAERIALEIEPSLQVYGRMYPSMMKDSVSQALRKSFLPVN